MNFQIATKICYCQIRVQESLINLWNEMVDSFNFLHRDTYQRKIASKTTTVGCVWSFFLSYTQTCLNLLGGDFG